MQVGYFEFLFETQNSFALPDFKGPTFRGKFGHVLKRTICVMKGQDCRLCPIRAQCPYIYLFETQKTNGQHVPRPFVIEPPLTHRQFFLKGYPLYLRLTLIGRAIEYLPYFVYCFDQMGKEGIGWDRGKLLLKAIYSVSATGEKDMIFDHDTQKLSANIHKISLETFKVQVIPQITIHFYTPTDIRVNGRPLLEISFTDLLKSILRRYHSLRFFHGEGQKERFEIDWDRAEQVSVVHHNLEFQRFKRYSNRQKKRVPMIGFTGRITYRGDLGPFYPWLKIGELIHVGKNTVFGMGGYRLV